MPKLKETYETYLQIAKEEIEKLTRQLADQEELLTQRDEAYHGLQIAFEQEIAEGKKLQKANQQLQRQLTLLEEQTSQEQEEIANKSLQLLALLADNEKRLKEAQSALKVKEKEIQTQQQLITALESQLTNHKEKISQLRQRIKELTARGKQQEQQVEISQLNNELEQLLTTKTEQEQQLVSYQNKVQQLEQEYQNQQSQIQSLQAEQKNLQKQQTTLPQRQRSKSVSSICVDLVRQESQSQHWQKQCQELTSQLQTLQTNYHNLEQEQSQSLTKLEDQESLIAELSTELTKSKIAAEETKYQLNSVPATPRSPNPLFANLFKREPSENLSLATERPSLIEVGSQTQNDLPANWAEQLAELKKSNQELLVEKQQLNQQITSLQNQEENQSISLKETIQSLETELNNINSQKFALELEKNKYQRFYQDLQVEIKDKVKSFHLMSRVVDHKEEYIDKLSQQIKQLGQTPVEEEEFIWETRIEVKN